MNKTSTAEQPKKSNKVNELMNEQINEQTNLSKEKKSSDVKRYLLIFVDTNELLTDVLI